MGGKREKERAERREEGCNHGKKWEGLIRKKGGVMRGGGRGQVEQSQVWSGRGRAELQTRADLGEMGSQGRRAERTRAVWS